MKQRTHRSLHPLAREIAIVIGLKLTALVVLFFAFFGPGSRPDIAAEGLQRTLFGAPAAIERSDQDV
jgi:hypothetical protein